MIKILTIQEEEEKEETKRKEKQQDATNMYDSHL